MLFEINFCDLKPEVQDALLKAVGVKEPEDMNWDRELPIMAPLAYYEYGKDEDDEQEVLFMGG